MAARYLPPHLRNKSRSDTTESDTADRADSTQVLAQRHLSDLKLSNDTGRPLYTLAELNHHFGSSLVHSTLRDTSTNPGSLGFVILFRGANPRWKTDHIVFAHTNINILPGYDEFKQQLKNDNLDAKDDTSEEVATASDTNISSDTLDRTTHKLVDDVRSNNTQAESSESAEAPTEHVLSHSTAAIPVFMDIGGHDRLRKFKFHGYFRLARVEFLKPQSPELVRMLQQKWQPTQRNPKVPPSRGKTRDATAWANSLSQEWAVVQFEATPHDGTLEDPKIEILPDPAKDLETGANGNDLSLDEAPESTLDADNGSNPSASSPNVIAIASDKK